MRRAKTTKTFVAISLLSLVASLAACAEDGTRDTAKTKNAALEPTLVNGNFAPNGGGWIGSRGYVDDGCASKTVINGRPSLGVWAKSGLAFGYDTTAVEQAVVVPQPSTVTFQIAGYVRPDNPDGWFKIDIADSNESQTSGRQTGKALLIAKVFRLTITTSRPNEYISIMMTGSSGNNWIGCYGPVLLAARLFVTSPAPFTTGGVQVLATAAPTTTTTVPAATAVLGGCAQIDKVRGWYCRNADLHGVDLRLRINLYANFRGANLAGADLRWATFTDSDFSGANLAGADLRWATFTGSDFSGANLTGAQFDGTNARSATFVGANFTSASFSGADFGMANFTDAILTNARVERSTFDAAKMIRADLSGASVSCSRFAVDMTGATTTGATFKDNLMLDATMPDGSRAPASGAIPSCVK